MLKTRVATLPVTSNTTVCTAACLHRVLLGCNGSFPPETAFVLTFKLGQLQIRAVVYELHRDKSRLPR